MGLIVNTSGTLPARQDAGDANMLARFLFAETSGTTFKNEVTGTNDLSIANGTPTLNSFGFFNRSLYIQGTSKNSVVSANGAWQPTGTLSIDLWVYPVTLLNGAVGRILLKSAFPTSWANPFTCFNLEIQSATGTIASSILLAGGAVGITFRDQIRTYQWQHIALVYDGATFAAYMNGIKQASSAATGNINWSSSGPWILSSLPTAVSAATNEGAGYMVEDLRINSGALSQTTIENRYRNGMRWT